MRLLFTVVLCVLAFPASARAVPYFELGVHDDGAILFNRDRQREPVLHRAVELGAIWNRTIVYRQRVKGGNFRLYRRAIRAANRRHIHVQMVIACNGVDWTPTSFGRYVRRVVRQLGRRVHRWSICNEPNQPGWLKAIPGLDLPTTYRLLYRTGYAAIKAVQPGAQSQVLFGEFSSNYYPLDFLRRVICDSGELTDRCQRVVTDCLAYHPYQLENPESPSKTPFTVGIGSLDLLVAERNLLYQQGYLSTPVGAPPPLCLTEFGYQSRGRGQMEERNLPDEIRKERWWQALTLACQSPDIQQLIIYQMVPNSLHRSTRWDTSIMSRSGKPDKTYFGIRRWRYAHPECMR